MKRKKDSEINKGKKRRNLAKNADFHNLEDVLGENYTKDPDEENSVFQQGTLKDVRESCEENIK